MPKTIDYKKAIERLKEYLDFEFSPAEKKVIEEMQDKRNKFEHYTVSTDIRHLWSTLVDFLDIIDRFLVDELNIKLEAEENSNELLNKISNINRVGGRLQEQQEQYEQEACESTLESVRNKSKEFAENNENILRVLGNARDGEYPFIRCRKCSEVTLISTGEYKGICSNPECDYCCSLTNCYQCGAPMEGFPWENNCCSTCEKSNTGRD
jgi:hypothetical protein